MLAVGVADWQHGFVTNYLTRSIRRGIIAEMPLDFRQEHELTGGGDCLLHYHSQDRVTNDILQSAENVVSVSSAYTVTYNDDIILATAATPYTITLPIARSRRVTIVRVSGNASITVVPTASDTINGASSVIISTSYTPLRLKAVAGIGYISV
jgi:hypothetical protein